MDSGNLIEPALLHRRCDNLNLMAFVVRVFVRQLNAGIISLVFIGDFRGTCLKPIARRYETKDDARYATK